MTKDEEIAALKAERDELVKELSAAYLLIRNSKDRLREVRSLREQLKNAARSKDANTLDT